MALKHAQPLDLIDLRISDAERGTARSSSLIKTAHLQLMHVVLAAGEGLPEHHVPGEVTIQCLEGEVDVVVAARPCRLRPGTLVVLPAAAPHSLQALQRTVLLVTLLLP